MGRGCGREEVEGRSGGLLVGGEGAMPGAMLVLLLRTGLQEKAWRTVGDTLLGSKLRMYVGHAGIPWWVWVGMGGWERGQQGTGAAGWPERDGLCYA